MSRQQSSRLRILSYVIASYMLLAFSWWTVLLLNQNTQIYHSRLALHAELGDRVHELSRAGIEEEYKNQRLMIIGEGLVFIFALLVGGWLINRGYIKEIEGIRQKRNFLLAITHELKSPLASIRLTLETFRKRNLSEDDKLKLSDNALKDTDRLTGLIDNLLLAAKLDKSYQPNFETLDVLQIIEQVVQDLQHLFPTANFHTKASHTVSELSADRQGLYSSLYNLCENAIKYGGEKGEVNIDLSNSEKYMVIRVADQGAGISDENKKKIFNQFYRVGNEETRQSTGTGLGLYIAQKMIQLHHGKIRVADNQPRGTIFSISIPIIASS